jgi:hypothetical protein
MHGDALKPQDPCLAKQVTYQPSAHASVSVLGQNVDGLEITSRSLHRAGSGYPAENGEPCHADHLVTFDGDSAAMRPLMVSCPLDEGALKRFLRQIRCRRLVRTPLPSQSRYSAEVTGSGVTDHQVVHTIMLALAPSGRRGYSRRAG